MRIIAGRYKGKKLIGSKDNSIRPTTNKIKEYIFNILEDFCQNKIVADYFCGSGNLGIESLSREAKKVVFIDYSPNSINILKKNLKNTAIDSDKYSIIKEDALKYSKHNEKKFDLIFMDPPFIYPPLNELVLSIFKNRQLMENGLLVVEHEISNPLNLDTRYFNIFKQKKIGRSLISFIISDRSKSG